MPRPINAIVLTVGSTFPLGVSSASQAVNRGRRRNILEADVAGVASGLKGAEVAVEVERAGARFAASGVVGDLYVGDPVGVRSQCCIDVIAIVGQVEQIAEEADVRPRALGRGPRRRRQRSLADKALAH